MDLLLPLIVAAVVTAVLIPLLEYRAGKLRLLDAPGERKIHHRAVPRVGGIAMAAGAATSFLIWLPISPQAVAYLAGAFIVLIFGIWDDRSDLGPWTKLVGQLLAAAVVFFAGGVEINSITLTSRIALPEFVVLPLTFFFLVGTTNAINLADGLDGLAGGTTLMCFAAIAALSAGKGLPFVSIVAFTMIGSLIGFLRFNSFPARVFMGDGGSQWLGFTAGVLAVLLTQDATLAYSAGLPLLLLGLPILDTLTVMIRRIAMGRSPFAADASHLHHRLLARGLNHFESVTAIYMLQGLLFLLAWFLRYESDLLIITAFLSFAVILLSALYLGKKFDWYWHGIGLGGLPPARLPRLFAPDRLPRWANLISWAAMSTYLIGIAVTSTDVGRDVSLLALALGGLLLAGLLRLLPEKSIAGLLHVAVYVGIAVIVYLDHVEPTKSAALVSLKFVIFPTIAVAVFLRMRSWHERRFEITTLDVLVVFLAIVLPNLPGLHQASSNLGLSVGKLVLLMYAAEVLTSHSARTRYFLWSSVAGAMILIGARGVGFGTN